MSTKKTAELEPVNEAGDKIQEGTVAGHNVQPAKPVSPVPRVRQPVINALESSENGIRPEWQPPTANVRSQIPQLHDEDLEKRTHEKLDEEDQEYLDELAALNEKHAAKQQKRREADEKERLKVEEKEQKDLAAKRKKEDKGESQD